MKILVVYYSLTGNTKSIAERLSKKLGADMAEIIPAAPYKGEYDDIVNEGEREVHAKTHRAIKPLSVDVANYEMIIVGSPTWWYTMAPAVLTFLSDNNFKNKVLIPFMTNAGWPGTVIQDMTFAAKQNGASVELPKEFRFKSYSSEMKTSVAELNCWMEAIAKQCAE